MSTPFVADVEDWERRPFDGGAAGLARLAEADFSGTVRADGAYLFLVGGRPVGAFEATSTPGADATLSPTDADAFADAAGEALSAPHRALPLLETMVAAGGESRGRYYSNDTPLGEVDRTLRDGRFTGYLELSENVLSGDYYLVYHRGSRQAVAFVGQSRRLKTDDEAFDLAADEVGIYEVWGVDLPRLSLPEPSEPELPRDPTVPTGDSESGTADTDTDASTEPDPDPLGSTGSAEGRESDEAAVEAAIERVQGETATDEPTATAGPSGSDEGEDRGQDPGATEGGLQTEDGSEDAPREFDPTAAAPTSPVEPATDGPVDADGPDGESGVDPDPDPDPEREPARHGELPGGSTSEDVAAAAVDAEATPEGKEGSTNGRGDRDDHVVPSVDPERTARGDPEPSADEGAENARERIVDGETMSGLRSELAARKERITELRERIDELEAERDDLEATVEELKRRLEAAGVGPASPSRTLTGAEALSATSLFVRYRSKRDPTLSDAHEGSADPAAVSENLRLERHTEFDASEVAVEGRSFEAFLTESQAYAFVEWLVRDLLYEIRDTGNAERMRALYDALPALDRIEFGGDVSLEGETLRFDVVGRDRMGTPLLVADLEDGREPADEVTMAELVNAAGELVETNDDLAAAFSVTAAYFEPAALETAREATGGSLLSRDRRKSFVKRSRKRGFHLCLVEAREGSFYLSVPEL
jgi:hypothetical protein